jgi:hypothetical protein
VGLSPQGADRTAAPQQPPVGPRMRYVAMWRHGADLAAFRVRIVSYRILSRRSGTVLSIFVDTIQEIFWTYLLFLFDHRYTGLPFASNLYLPVTSTYSTFGSTLTGS